MAATEEVEQAGARIEAALAALEQIEDHRLRATATEALRLIVGLYGDALGRVVELLAERAPGTLATLHDDPLLASLLIVHDLHRQPVTERVERALEEVRPYLGSHGGDVELLAVEGDVVRLRLLGSCDGCASSSITLKLAVETAITEAAPEIRDIEVEEPSAAPSTPLIAPETLLQRPAGFDLPGANGPAGSAGGARPEAASEVAGEDGSAAGPSWQRLADHQLPAAASVAAVRVGHLEVVLARTDAGATYAYLDGCPTCTRPLAGASLDGATLACPACAARFDLAAAGRGVDGTEGALTPLPLLHRDGAVELAVPAVAAR